MRALLFETRTGQPVIDLERSAWSFDTGILAPDRLDVTVPAYTPRALSLDLRGLLVAGKYSVALVDESVEGVRRVAAAGPIVAAVPAEDADGNHTYRVSCRGVERLLERRHVRLFPGWPLLDGDNKPTGTYDQTFEDVEYGTMMKRLVAESELWPGGGLPVTFEADRAGSHELTKWAAIDGKTVLEALDQLADLSDGVEYDFRPVVDEFDAVSFEFRTGTDASRSVGVDAGVVWNLGGGKPDVRNYQRIPSPVLAVSDAVFSGGKDVDKVLLVAAEDHTLIGEGHPRAELWDSSHSTVSEVSTLQSWADGALGADADRFAFDVLSVRAGGVRHGDFVTVEAQGHWDLPDGSYPLRVLSVARSSATPDWVAVQLV